MPGDESSWIDLKCSNVEMLETGRAGLRAK